MFDDFGSIVFNYSKAISNHHEYRHCIDGNNNIRMQPIAIETAWDAKDWEYRLHAFCLGVSHVNSQKGFDIFGGDEKESTLFFRKKLAEEIIYNVCILGDNYDEHRTKGGKKKARFGVCELKSLPKYCAFRWTEIV